MRQETLPEVGNAPGAARLMQAMWALAGVAATDPEICPQKAPNRHNRQMKMHRHRNGSVRPAENK